MFLGKWSRLLVFVVRLCLKWIARKTQFLLCVNITADVFTK